MTRKNDLDLRVAFDLGISRRRVSMVTQSFLRELKSALITSGSVTIDGLGRFRVVEERNAEPTVARLTKGTFKKGESSGKTTVEVPVTLRVHFSKSPTFKKELDRARR